MRLLKRRGSEVDVMDGEPIVYVKSFEEAVDHLKEDDRYSVWVKSEHGDYEMSLFSEYGRKEKPKGADMTTLVIMTCAKCAAPVRYKIEASCPSCGMIIIACEACGYRFDFGE